MEFYNYHRAFLLINKEIDFLNNSHTWKKIYFPTKNILYYTVDIICELEISNNYWCCCLGTFFDTLNFNVEISTIKKIIVEKLNKSENDFFNYLDTLNGRYVIFYSNKERVCVGGGAILLMMLMD